MKISFRPQDTIPLDEFELSSEFKSSIPQKDWQYLHPLSETTSKEVYKILKHYKTESNRIFRFNQTDWFRASAESEESIQNFQKFIEEKLKDFPEDLLINWHRNQTIRMSKSLFLHYWNSFLHPKFSQVFILSTQINWFLEYHYTEIANLWTNKSV